MSSIRSHLTVLEQSAQKFGDLPAFRLPIVDPDTKTVLRWRSVSYQQFLADVERVARYWRRRLSGDGITHRSVVGLWLGGMAYTDVVHVYAVARAGYIPQLFSLRLPNPDVIYELMAKADAKALIFDTSSVCSFDSALVPTYPAILHENVESSCEPLPSITENLTGADTFCIFHTSGSTSGSPKVIRCNFSWLDNIIAKADFLCRRRNPARQDVTTWVGSMSHIAQTFMLIGALHNGACTVQPSRYPFPPAELIDMVERCQLNCLRLFGTFLSSYIRASRSNPALLTALKSLDEAFFCGIGLVPDDEAFAIQQGIPLRNIFGSTEVGAMLYTPDGERFMRQLPGTKYAWVPIDGEKTARARSNSGPRNANNSALLELVILRESADCPDSSLCAEDGNYHTGDLFQQVMPGSFVFRGRNDDWIKSENSLRCDTKAIEDNVRAMCADLVEDCIVVGSGRPSPTLFVEPAVQWDEAKLRKEIIRRTKHFHSRRYIHERIVNPALIIVVPSRTLPRTATKGNIRRRAVEETFSAELDNAYAAVAASIAA